jgi:D-xylose transport system permease protein
MALHPCRTQPARRDTTVFVLVALGLAVTVVLGVLLRIWSGTVSQPCAVTAGDRPAEPVVGDAARSLHGCGHGIFTGFRVPGRMPSFVVTLALFIAWQG